MVCFYQLEVQVRGPPPLPLPENVPKDGKQQGETVVSLPVPVKNITARLGENVTVTCQALYDYPIVAIELNRPGLGDQYAFYYREGLVDPGNQHPSYENRVWLDICSNMTYCKNLSLILLIENSTYYGPYIFSVKVKYPVKDPQKEPICIVNLMPPRDPVPVKNITARLGENVTVTCQALYDYPIVAIELNRPGLGDQYAFYYREGLVDPGNQHPSYENRVWLDICSNMTYCKNLSLILLIENSTYYGPYIFSVKVKYPVKDPQKEPICIVNLMPPRDPDDLTTTPTAGTPTTETPTTDTPTTETPTTVTPTTETPTTVTPTTVTPTTVTPTTETPTTQTPTTVTPTTVTPTTKTPTTQTPTTVTPTTVTPTTETPTTVTTTTVTPTTGTSTTGTPTTVTPSTGTTTTETLTSANSTAEMSHATIVGITIPSALVLALVVALVLVGVYLLIKRRRQSDQRGDYQAGEHELHELNGVHHDEDNGDTSV
ncbi:junctional adhesion molecule B-like isoform X5 [Scomber scombrus]|uniref:Junctional adhesion molecule B-like isoform X5 n=1 Tax=Scomber scombrus TaxID=13677 RepID=A0AAV1QAV5_SCOSC